MPSEPSTAAPALTTPPPPNAGGELRCPQCDYDLRALTSGRCPECGLAIDHADLAASRIPWTYRAKMGRVRAYWKTVWLATLRPRRLAMEVAGPVSLGDAKRFQHVTVWLAFGSIVVVASLAAFAAFMHRDLYWPGRSMFEPDVRLGWILQWASIVFDAACVWLFLLAVSGFGSNFFRPKSLSVERQNRAVALSFYSCAPFAWTVLPALFSAAAIGAIASTWNTPSTLLENLTGILILASFALIAVQIGAFWRCSLVLLKRTTECPFGRRAAFGFGLPIGWIGLAILFLGVLPFAFVFVCLLIVSLRH